MERRSFFRSVVAALTATPFLAKPAVPKPVVAVSNLAALKDATPRESLDFEAKIMRDLYGSEPFTYEETTLNIVHEITWPHRGDPILCVHGHDVYQRLWTGTKVVDLSHHYEPCSSHVIDEAEEHSYPRMRILAR